MWFGTSVWSPLQKKTDRGETERVRNRRGEGRVVGPQGCSERSPQFFHHCCRHQHGGGVASEQSQGDSVPADAKCVCVCGGGGGKKDGGARARQGQSDCVGSRQFCQWLMKLKVSSGNSGAAGGGDGEGRWKEPWSKPAVNSPTTSSSTTTAQLPACVCVWCLFTSLFNHGAVPVVDWHKMTAA